VLMFMIGILLKKFDSGMCPKIITSADRDLGQVLRYVISFILILTLTACNAPSVFDWFTKPMLLDLRPPPGPPDYQAAYVDGCTTAVQENNQNVLALHFRGLYKHPDMNNKSPVYRSVWRSAYIFCGLWVPYQSRNRLSFFTPDYDTQIKSMPWTPRRNLLFDAPPGPYPFREGWKEGCITGKSSTGSSHQKMVYKFVKSAEWIEGDRFNPEFEKGWETAFWWCQRYYDIIESPDRQELM
jgi:hypothetical protein